MMAQSQSQHPEPESSIIQDEARLVHRNSSQYQRGGDLYDDNFVQDILNDEQDESDADSDYNEFTASMNKLRQDVRLLKNPGHDPDQDMVTTWIDGIELSNFRSQARQRIGQPERRGTHKGIRPAAEPTGDIKMRLAQASEAYIEKDYLAAIPVLQEIIRINGEIYEAWTLLAEIFKEIHDTDNALTALMFGAHLRHRDPSTWMACAEFALDETGPHRPQYLLTAQFCYAAILRVDHKHLEARRRKAAIQFERGRIGPATTDYKLILAQRPHDRDALRNLAVLYIDQGKAETAIALYKESIAYFRSSSRQDQLFDWTDLDTYVTLYEHCSKYDIAIQELRSLSRWLLGREEEGFWDEVTDDDREWDVDDSRRDMNPVFRSGKYSLESYGAGLPLDIRVRFGVYRLYLGNRAEAFAHFGYLTRSAGSEVLPVSEHPQLFRLVADALFTNGHYQDALDFYQPLKDCSDQPEVLVILQIGRCLLRDGRDQQAEECFLAAIGLDREDIEAQWELTQLYEKMGKTEKAYEYFSETLLLRNKQKTRRRPHAQRAGRTDRDKTAQQAEKQATLKAKSEYLRNQYLVIQNERDGMRGGNASSIHAWLEAARDLTDDFRSLRAFYPLDKYVKFLSSWGESHEHDEALDQDLAAMAERLTQGLSTESHHVLEAAVPNDYRGIPYTAWLDVFLEYALCLARTGRTRESYSICEAAVDAVVFYRSREDIFLIHICWCVCALFGNDERGCVSVARFFMKDYQFTTDSYRMFAALTRICHSPVSWYSAGPSQKYILRQIKLMDYTLVSRDQREKYYSERGSYSAIDENGNKVTNTDLDIALLMLYGHILVSGTSYSYALNYFLRAHALDPTNPMINLSIGLAYIHLALKRQTDNRQSNILQGIAFVFRYYNARATSSRYAERQEAHFNVARTYHMLGLGHLAIPYYWKCLNEPFEGVHPEREDLAIEAAYNMQTLYATSGNLQLAEDIARQWLVI